MAKIKFTKGELKKQRDALKRYQRYLPTLQLKKQQLQAEIMHELLLLQEKKDRLAEKRIVMSRWAGLLKQEDRDLTQWITCTRVITRVKNIAGLDLPVFEKAEFNPADYDLFVMPLWVDAAIAAIRDYVYLDRESKVIEEDIRLLREELRTTAQRVNLFEKVKIPQAQESIRRIKIYIGDQMANAVGRSKTAKRKIEVLLMQEAFA